MEEKYIAQFVTVKDSMVYSLSCNARIKNGKIWLQTKNNKEKEYEIENITSYSNEKLIAIREDFDLSFSMLMSFAGAIFIQLNLLFSAILVSMALYDIYKKTNFKYVILSENKISKAEDKILQFLQNQHSKKVMKRAA